MSTEHSPDRRFLDEAVERGVLDATQAAHCRRLLDALAEVEVDLGAAEIAIRKGYVTKAQADELKRALARRRVGRYEVLERLGRGGTGVVWRARDVRLGRVVALKLLGRPGRPDDLVTSYHARFRREAQTAVTLNHVNVVRGLDYGETDGYVYFAMELVPGESAAERLRRVGRIDEPEALRIALQVVEALQYVRAFGLVHRDLKPENLLLTPNGEVKVCDLGLAKPTVQEAARLGSAGTIAGTPLYMAPEQVRDPDSVDWSTDVYGLGATLYHLLTGRPPFLPGPTRSVLQCHLDEAPEDPRAHVIELSAGASAVVLKMLAKDPAERYASLEELASDLAAVAERRPPSFALRLQSAHEGAVAGVLAETHGVRARLRTRRRRGAWLAAAAAASWIALGLAWSWRPAPTESPAVASRVADRPPVEDAPLDGAPAPSDERVAAGDPGRAPLATARRSDRDSVALDQRIRAYEFVVERHREHPSGKIAAGRLRELRIELDARAAAELTRRRRAAAAALERGEIAVAADELLAFPPLYHATDAFGEAMRESARITREGRAEAERWLEQARLEAVAWRFEAAHALTERARRTGLPGLSVPQVEKEIELERSARDTERAERLPRWQVAAGRALMVALDDPVAAAHVLDAEVASGKLRTYVDEIDALRYWLPRAHAARVRLDEAWSHWAAAGRRLELRTVGPHARDVDGVPVAVSERRLTLARAADALVVVRAEELPVELLTEAISPGGTPVAGGVDDMAAFLLATRRLREAAAFQAPPDLVDVVRAAAVADATTRLDRAAVLVAAGETAAGRAALEATLAYAPWYGPAHTALGRLFTELGSLDEAVATLEAALAVDVPDPVAHIHVASVLERRRRFADAESHLRRFLDETVTRSGDEVAALRSQAASDLERVKEQRHLATLETLRRDGRNALRAGRAGEAAEIFDSILTVRPDDPEALLELGRLRRDAGRIFDAFRAWTRLVARHPEDRRAREAQRGIAGLERFRSGLPAGRDALKEAREHRREERHDEAVAGFRRAIRLSPFLVDAHLGLAESLVARGEAAQVRDDLTTAVAVAGDVLLLAPDLTAAVLLRARARFLLGDLAAALDDAEDAARRLAEPSAALLLAGRTLLALDRLDEAVTRFEEAFDARAHPDPLYWQALALQRQGHRPKARLKLDLLYDTWGAPPHLEVQCARLYNELRD